MRALVSITEGQAQSYANFRQQDTPLPEGKFREDLASVLCDLHRPACWGSGESVLVGWERRFMEEGEMEAVGLQSQNPSHLPVTRKIKRKQRPREMEELTQGHSAIETAGIGVDF